MSRRSSFGQATIEFLYVIPLLLLLMLASIQFAFIYQAKQTLNYATFVGTRAGALNSGAMAAIQEGVTSGLAPLFTHGDDLQALKNARKTAKTELYSTTVRLAKIEIINPTISALSGFSNSNGEIPNDNLMYRSPTATEDGMNVQDANLLKVRVTYCVRLVVPIVNRLIHMYAVSPAPTLPKIESYVGGSIAAPELLKASTAAPAGALCVGDAAYPYRIPVSSESVVRMQSPFKDPGKWVAP